MDLKTPWTSAIEVDWTKTDGETSRVVCLSEGSRRQFVSTAVAPAPGVFGRTQVLTVAPTFILNNTSTYEVQIALDEHLAPHEPRATRKTASKHEVFVTIAPGAHVDAFFSPKARLRMRFRVLEDTLPTTIFPSWSRWCVLKESDAHLNVDVPCCNILCVVLADAPSL